MVASCLKNTGDCSWVVSVQVIGAKQNRMDVIKSKSQIPHVTAFALLCAFFPLSMHYMGGLSVAEGIKLGASKYDFQSKLITVNHKHDLK